jgi:tryptophan synthase alpha chain
VNRIDAAFKTLRRRKKKALILFVTAGDPSERVTLEFLRFAEEAGVDCVEIGVPFSDPLADGPVIQASSFRAIRKGVNLRRILALVRRARREGLRMPLVLMSSYNPLLQYGPKRVFAEAKVSGIDGIIIPDLPVHEAEAAGVLRLGRDFGVHNILMIAPTTTEARKRLVASKARGFLYYVSLKGVTGARAWSGYPFTGNVARLRRKTKLPVCVGFGISNPRQAADIARAADGVIVGSAVVADLARRSGRGLTAASRAWIRGFVRAVKGGAR